jgi:hypothetical protein
MTVCAAAVCKAWTKTGLQDVLLAISDRMITSGDIEYETSFSKIYGLSIDLQQPTKIIALGAGDQDSHNAIIRATHEEMKRNGTTDVGEAARLYGENFAALRKRQAEKSHLAFLGLDADSFIARQQEMDSAYALDLSDRLRSEELGVHTIIAGVDATGPHIYSVGSTNDRDEETCHEICHDSAAFFYAVGYGSRQFETQYMSARYDRNWPLAPSLLLMYLAKKRAEVSPGVGPSTDMAYIDSSMSIFFGKEWIDLLEKYFRDYEGANAENWGNIVGRILTDGILIATPQKQETHADQAKPAAAHEKGVPGSPQEGKPKTPIRETGEVKPTLPSESPDVEPPSESCP